MVALSGRKGRDALDTLALALVGPNLARLKREGATECGP